MSDIVILFLCALVIYFIVRNHTLKSHIRLFTPCERCGSIGSTELFKGSPSYPNVYQKPMYLCLSCRKALTIFLEKRFILEKEGVLNFASLPLIKSAEFIWGDRAIDMLAALSVAQKNLDTARLLFKQDTFKLIKPWMEKHLEEIDCLDINNPPQKIKSIEQIKIVCSRCGKNYEVTLNLYENHVICPECHHLENVHIDWYYD